MPLFQVSLAKLYHTAANYIPTFPISIFHSSGIIYPIIRQNKKSSLIALASAISYGALTYYEFMYFNKIMIDWNDYNSVFSLFARKPSSKNEYCPIPLLMHATRYDYPICSVSEGNLFRTLTKGQIALTKYTVLKFFKPLLLEVCAHALTFSLRSTLIKKWLGTCHSQLGLQLFDQKISLETREIIGDYSYHVVAGILDRISIPLDIIIAVGRAYSIYQLGESLITQGLDFHIAQFMIIAIGLYLLLNLLLNVLSKHYAESTLAHQLSFKNSITFNMENAFQVECGQATSHEFDLLNTSLNNVTKAYAIRHLVSNTTSTVGMTFINLLPFHLLTLAVPSIVKNPALYFSLQQVSMSISSLSASLWQICSKISISTTLPFTYKKITAFIDTIDQYLALLALEKVKFTIAPTAHLSCDLNISYPSNRSDSLSSNRAVLENFKKEFFPGKIYVIKGPSGSGKSSFFNALAGINPFATGKVTITDRKNIIYVPQKPIFKQNLSWIQTILYPLGDEELILVELERKILEWVSILKLEAIYQDAKTSSGWVNKLSGGEAQRLSIIQALTKTWIGRKKSSENTVLLLLDEALNSLDPEMQETAVQLLARHVEEYKLTAIHIDHSDKSLIKRRYAEDHIISFQAYPNIQTSTRT